MTTPGFIIPLLGWRMGEHCLMHSGGEMVSS